MRSVLSFLPLLVFLLVFQGCQPKNDEENPVLPLSGGIQVSLHTIGGSAALNESVQISDHWQLSSVGRRHGWIRKLESDEQRMLVKAMQGFETLTCSTESHGVGSILIAKGSGVGEASKEEAATLGELVQKLVVARRIASR